MDELAHEIASPRAPRDWEIGETVAELLVEQIYRGWFPWPTSFDLRTETASLPGPDLVGLRRGDPPVLAFGEVKSSSEQRSPPQVVTKADDGLATQVRRLLTDARRRQTLVEWLVIRGRTAEWRGELEKACAAYFANPCRAWVVGVLVRGATDPNEDDILAVTKDLGPTSLELHVVAIHLPFKKDDWPSLLAASEGPS